MLVSCAEQRLRRCTPLRHWCWLWQPEGLGADAYAALHKSLTTRMQAWFMCRAALMAVYAAEALVLALAARLAQQEGPGGDALPRRSSSRSWSRGSSKGAGSFLGACLPPGLGLPDSLGSSVRPCLIRTCHLIGRSAR